MQIFTDCLKYINQTMKFTESQNVFNKTKYNNVRRKLNTLSKNGLNINPLIIQKGNNQ